MSTTDIGDRVGLYKRHTDYAVLAIYMATSTAHFQPPPGAKYMVNGSANVADGGRYLISITEFQDRIDFILKTDKNSLKLPPSVSTSLDTAARLRDEVTDLLTQREFADCLTGHDKDADRKHKWFSRFLQDTNLRLQRAGVFRVQNIATEQSPECSAKRTSIKTQNSFSALTVEEQGIDPQDTDSRPQPHVELVAAAEDADRHCEIADDFIRANTVFNDFLQELDTMRTECHSAWTRVFNKKLDMCAAGVVANTAICFARNTEERISKCLDEFGGTNAFWEAHYARSTGYRLSGDKVEKEERRQVIAAYDQLLDNGCAVFHHSRVLHARANAGGNVTDFRRLYETTLKPLSRNTAIPADVRYTNDQNFLLQLEREVSFMAAFRYVKGVTCLGPHVVDELLHYHIQVSKGHENTKPIWVLFARQVYLDVAHIFGDDIHRPLRELQAFCCALWSPMQMLRHRWEDEAAKEGRAIVLSWGQGAQLEIQMDFIMRDATLPLKSFLRHPTGKDRRVVNGRSNRHRYALNGPDRAKYHYKRHFQGRSQPSRVSESHRSRVRSRGVRFQHGPDCRRRSASGQRCRCATPQPFRLLRWHPVLCSLLMWSVRHKQQSYGIIASNNDFSITASMSLCDFLIREGYSQTEPPDLAILRRLHDDDSFFHGGKPAEPRKPFKNIEQRRCYEKKYLATLGYIANGQRCIFDWNPTISPHLARDQNSLVKNGSRAMKSITQVYDAFLSQFGVQEADRRRDWTPEAVMCTVSDSRWVTSFDGQDIIVRRKEPGKKPRVHKSSSPMRALKCLGGALHAEAWGASIPYAEILLECKDFLENQRKAAESWLPLNQEPRHPFRDEWHGRIELPGISMHLWAMDADGSFDSDLFRPMGEVAEGWAKGIGSASCRRMFDDEEMGLPRNDGHFPLLGQLKVQKQSA